MRKIIFLFFLIVSIQTLQAFNNYAIICGRVKNAQSKELNIVIYKDASSGLEFVFNPRIDPEGNFKAFVDIEFPVIGYLKLGQYASPIYLQPDDSLYLVIDESNFNGSVKFSGKGEANLNMYTAFFYLTEIAMKDKASKVKRSFNDVSDEEFIFTNDSFTRTQLNIIDSLKKVFEPSSEFYLYFKTETYYRNANQVVSFPLMKNYMNKSNTPPTYSKPFVDFVLNQNLNDETLSRHPDYIKFLNSTLTYFVIASLQPNENISIEELYNRKYKFIIQKIKSRRLQLALMAAVTSEALENNQAKYVQKMYDEFIKETADKVLADALKDKMKEIAFLVNGSKATNFTLSDLNGKKVSLNDFKGKLIYLDFWATWCGPCMMEMPHSIELQKKFVNDKNIVFLFVSIDDDEQKWKNVVKERNITGTHLISPGRTSAIVKTYNLESIPRHYLIGKDGMVIDTNAPGPSDKNTEQLIRKYLK